MRAKRVLTFLLAVVLIMSNTLTATAATTSVTPLFDINDAEGEDIVIGEGDDNSEESDDISNENGEDSEDIVTDDNTPDDSDDNLKDGEDENDNPPAGDTEKENPDGENQEQGNEDTEDFLDGEGTEGEEGDLPEENEEGLLPEETEELLAPEPVLTEVTGEEQIVTLTYKSSASDSVVKAAIETALTNACEEGYPTTLEDGTVVYKLDKSMILNEQLNFKRLGHEKVLLIADAHVTLHRGSSFAGSNLILVNGQKISIGAEEGMEGSITIDGGAVVAENNVQYPDLTGTVPDCEVTYSNTGITAGKGLMYVTGESEVTLYEDVVFTNNVVYRSYSSLKNANKPDYFANACVIGNDGGSVLLEGCEITGCGYIASGDSDWCMPLISNKGKSASLVINDVDIHDNLATGVKWQESKLSGNKIYLYGEFVGSGIVSNWAGTVEMNGGRIVDSKNRRTTAVDASVAILNAGTFRMNGNPVIGNADSETYIGKGYQIGILNSCGAFGNGYNYATSTKVSFSMNGGEVYPGVVNYGRFEMAGGTLGAHYKYYEGSAIDNCCSFKVSGSAYDDYNAYVDISGGTLTAMLYNEGYVAMSGGTLVNSEMRSRSGLETYTANADDKWKTKFEMSGGIISGFEYGIHACDCVEVVISEDAVIEDNYGSGVCIVPYGVWQVESGYVTAHESGECDVIMTGGVIRNNGQSMVCSSDGAVKIFGYGGRFILEGGEITGNKGDYGSAFLYDNDDEEKGTYPYIIIRGGKVYENYSFNGYAKEDHRDNINCSPIKDGSVFISNYDNVMVFEGVTASEVFFQNFSGVTPEVVQQETVTVSSYEDLCNAFSCVEADGTRTFTIDRNICIAGTVVIPEGEVSVLDTSTDIMITRDIGFKGDLFDVKSDADFSINKSTSKQVFIDGKCGYGALAENGSVFYVKENAELYLGTGISILNHTYNDTNEEIDDKRGSIITNYGSCYMENTVLRDNKILKNGTALIHNINGTMELKSVKLYGNKESAPNTRAIYNAGECKLTGNYECVEIEDFDVAIVNENILECNSLSAINCGRALLQDGTLATANLGVDVEITLCQNALEVLGGEVALSEGAVVEYLDGFGVVVSEDGHFVLDGGEISNCGLIGITDGAAIKMISDDAKVTLKSGTLTENEATTGCAIYREGKGKVTISGGSVTGNYSLKELATNRSGVTDGSFYADCTDNIIWDGVTAEEVFVNNYTDTMPEKYGGNLTISSQSAFESCFPIINVDGKKVRFLHDVIYWKCEIVVDEEEIWIPIVDTTIMKSAFCKSMIRVKNGGDLTLGHPDFADRNLVIDGGGSSTEYSQKQFGDYRRMLKGQGLYLGTDNTVLFNEAGAECTVLESVTIQRGASRTDYYGEDIVTGSSISNYGILNLKGGLITKSVTTFHDDDMEYSSSAYNKKNGDVPCILNKGEDAVLVIDGTVFKENMTGGTAILSNLGGKVVMESGQIQAYRQDGGFQNCIYNTGEFVMNGGSIEQAEPIVTYGSWYKSRPAAVINSGLATMNSGLITGSVNNVYNEEADKGYFVMTDGKIVGFNIPVLKNTGRAIVRGGELLETVVREQYGYLPNAVDFYTIDNRPASSVDDDPDNNGYFEMTGGHVTFDYDDWDMSSFDDYKERWPTGVYNSGNAYIKGGIVERFYRGIFNIGEMTISGGSIRKNIDGLYYGGYSDFESTTILEEGARIHYNYRCGANIDLGYSNAGVKLIVNGGAIEKNGSGARETGGIRAVGENVKVIVNGGTIKENFGNNGSAIYLKKNAAVELNGGTITKNYNIAGNIINVLPAAKDVSVYADGGTIKVKDGKKITDIVFNNYSGEPQRIYIASMKPYLYLAPNQSAALNVKLTGEDEVNYKVTQGKDVVSVDENGVVTALKSGTAYVYATCFSSDYQNYCRIDVQDLYIEPEELTMGRGEGVNITLMERKTVGSEEVEAAATVVPKWSSADENIASVSKDSNGNIVISGEGVGTTAIKAVVTKKYGNSTGTLICEVPVTVSSAVREVNLNKTNLPLTQGSTKTLQANVLPYDTDDAYTIEWESADPSVATVETSGRTDRATVKALKKGTVEVTVSVKVDGEVRAENTCEVIVSGLDEVPQLEPIYVLTNISPKLADVSLPEGYSWKETRAGDAGRTKLTASDEAQEFTVNYANDTTRVYGETNVTLYVGTITGISTEKNVYIEKGGENAQSIVITPVYKGTVDESVLEYMEAEASAAGLLSITKDEQTAEQDYVIEASDTACGKTLTVRFKAKLAGADTGNFRQKGKMWFESKVRVKVAKEGQHYASDMYIDTDALRENYKVEENDGKVTIVLDADEIQNEQITLPVVVKNKAGADVTAETKLSYKSNNRGIARVAKDGVITPNKKGIALITVTASDGSGKKVQVYLDIRSYKPRLLTETVYRNLATTKDTTLSLYVQDDSYIVEEELTLCSYDKTSKEYVDVSDLFTVAVKADNLLVIDVSDELDIPEGESEKYSLILNSRVAVGDGEDEIIKNYENAGGNAFELIVENSMPEIIISQEKPANTFYKDETVTVLFEADGQEIVSVTADENAPYMITDAEYAYGDARVTLAVKDSVEDLQLLKEECIFTIELKDYSNSVNVPYRINTKYVAPELGFESGKLIITPEWNLYTVKDVLKNKADNTVVDLTDVSIETVDGVTTAKTGKPGELEFTVSDETLKETAVSVMKENWREPVVLTQKIICDTPKARLSKDTIVLSNTQDLTTTAAQESKLQLSQTVHSIKVKAVEAADDKTRSSLSAGTLIVKKDDSSVMSGVQVVRKKGKTMIADKGTYSVWVTPQIVVREGDPAMDMEPVKLTVKVVSEAPSITITGKSRFDVLDRKGKGITKFTVNVNNTSLDIVDMKVGGAGADRFDVVYADGMITVIPKEDAVFFMRNSYVITPVFTMEDGSTLIGNNIAMHPYQPAYKVMCDTIYATLYRGAYGSRNGTEVNVSVLSTNRNIAGEKGIERVTCLTKGFKYDNFNNILYISNPELLGSCDVVKVRLEVDVKGQASDAKTQKVTVYVKLRD